MPQNSFVLDHTDRRLSELRKRHSGLMEKAKDFESPIDLNTYEGVLLASYRSLAANVWDTICELERIREFLVIEDTNYKADPSLMNALFINNCISTCKTEEHVNKVSALLINYMSLYSGTPKVALIRDILQFAIDNRKAELHTV